MEIQENCPFCDLNQFSLVAENKLSYAIRDKYPVTRLHTLIISKTHYATVFDLPLIELNSIFELAKACRGEILKVDPSVAGFNFGSNAGSAAGQKIMHVHFHLIPRRTGDNDPPPAMR